MAYEKMNAASELSERKRGGISALPQRTGTVRGGMLLQFKDQMMQANKRLDYKLTLGSYYKKPQRARQTKLLTPTPRWKLSPFLMSQPSLW